MKTITNIRFRIYPTKEQELLMNKTFGCCRLIYNNYLAERNEFWNRNKDLSKEHQEKLTSKTFTSEKQWKEKYPFLKEVSSAALQQSRLDCNTAFNNWFKSIKGLNKGNWKHPRFKSKKNNRHSYREVMLKEDCFDYDHRTISVPKLGKIKFKSRKKGNKNYKIEKVRNLTIIKEPDGRYYITLCCDVVANHFILVRENQSIGLDWSPKQLYIDSNGENGEKYGYKPYKQVNACKLHKLQKNLMRKKLGSNNRNKARIKVARLEKHIANARKDFLEKESLRLVKEYAIIGIEDLNLKGIVKFLRNAKNVNDCGWAGFVSMLENKAVRYNSVVIKADRFYPSSKLCSVCNEKNDNVSLKTRKWTCLSCKTFHNRDLNAAINLRNNALKTVGINQQATVGSTGIHACGDINRCSASDVVQVKSLKQEVKDASLNELALIS